MTIDEFWNIVERVHAAAPNDMNAKSRGLAEELRRLPAREIASFAGHFGDCFYRAYKWEIWDAAYLINHGCSDDGFMDFRSTLISLGRAPFEAALRNADDLADFEIDPAWAAYEGYQYVPSQVYKEKAGDAQPEPSEPQSGRKRPRHATGVRCEEWEMCQRFPKLAAKCGHKDSDYLHLKERKENGIRDRVAARRLANLMLDSGLISSSGLIPQPRIVAQVVRTGRLSSELGTQRHWEPFTLDEGHFWIALSFLQETTPDDLKNRPDLAGIKLRLDTESGTASTFEGWIASLKARGLA